MLRKPLKIAAWVLGSVAGLLALSTALVLVAGNTDPGRAMIERITAQVTGGMVQLSGLGGSFPTRLTLRHLELTDKQGVWLTADAIALTWTPLALLERRISVDRLDVAHVDMERTPHSSGGGGNASVPHIEVRRFDLGDVRLGAELAGRAARVSLRGGMDMRSLDNTLADVRARRIDGDGEYAMHLKLDAKRMDGTLSVHEPASGPLENILKLPGLGALDADLSINGPHEAELIDLKLTAGQLKAAVSGRIDLRQGSMDVNYSVDAPAVAPRPDLKWRRLSLIGQWHGTFKDPTAQGQLQADGLVLPGDTAIAALQADLAARQGTISMRGSIEGLRIPGPQAALFEKDPIKISASMRVAEDTRPLTVEATHPLLSLKAHAITAGRPSVVLDVQVPRLAPFAALAGQDVAGTGNIQARVDFRESDIGLRLDATAGLSGGKASWIGILGNRAVLNVAGSISDSTFTLDRAVINARSIVLTASGTAARPASGGGGAASAKSAFAAADAYVRDIKARWDLRVADLGILRPELAGSMQASGTLNGAPSSFNGDAEARSTLSIRGSAPGAVAVELHARGLPSTPSASVDVRGTVDGSPLTLSASLQRNGGKGFEGSIRRGEWKSAHADGRMSMTSSIDDARGHLHLEVGQLADLDRLVGAQLEGSLDGAVDFTPRAGHTRAKFQLDAKDLSAGRFSGTIHVAGEGDTSAVAAQLHVQSANLGGFPAELSANAAVNLDTHRVRIDQAALDYRGQRFALLSPARVSYSDGLKVDELRLGAQDAVLQIEGEILPTLDAHASLQHVDPKLIGVFLPDLISEGAIEGNAHIQGSLAAPTGRISLNAHDIRFASDQALGLPALNLTANADLAGDTASLDVRLSAGKASLFTMTGKTPLDAAGDYDLKLNGKLDLSVANPLFEARGMHVGGDLAVDASVGGKLETPQITGSVKLAARKFPRLRARNEPDRHHRRSRRQRRDFADQDLQGDGGVGDGEHERQHRGASTEDSARPAIDRRQGAAGDERPGDRQCQCGSQRQRYGARAARRRGHDPHQSCRDRDSGFAAARCRGARCAAAWQACASGCREATGGGPGCLGGCTTGDSGAGARSGCGARREPQDSRDHRCPGGQRSGIRPAARHLLARRLHAGVRQYQPGELRWRGPQEEQSRSDARFHGHQHGSEHHRETADNRLCGCAEVRILAAPRGLRQDEIMALLLFGQPAAQLSALQVAQVGAALATLSGVGGSGGNPLTKVRNCWGSIG